MSKCKDCAPEKKNVSSDFACEISPSKCSDKSKSANKCK